MKDNDTSSQPKLTKPRKVKPVGADGHRERMYERFLNAGDNTINPRDLVEMLLYYPIRIRDTRDSAVLLMDRHNGDIRKILDADSASLCKIDGIGASCAQFLNIAGEAVRRLNFLPSEVECRTDIERIGEIFTEKYSYSHENEFWVAYFDVNGQLVSVTKTGYDYCSVTTEDIMSLSHMIPHKNITSIAFAHFTAELDSLPDHFDVRVADLICVTMEFSNLTLIDYMVVNCEEAISLLSNKF